MVNKFLPAFADFNAHIIMISDIGQLAGSGERKIRSRSKIARIGIYIGISEKIRI